jgi:hypothetical protein
MKAPTLFADSTSLAALFRRATYRLAPCPRPLSFVRLATLPPLGMLPLPRRLCRLTPRLSSYG